MSHTAFIGVGNMGGPMARNLSSSGREVKVFDLSPQAMQVAAEGGAVPSQSAAQAVEGAATVVKALRIGRIHPRPLGHCVCQVSQQRAQLPAGLVLQVEIDWQVRFLRKRSLQLQQQRCLPGAALSVYDQGVGCRIAQLVRNPGQGRLPPKEALGVPQRRASHVRICGGHHLSLVGLHRISRLR